jgi:hypothetical protein
MLTLDYKSGHLYGLVSINFGLWFGKRDQRYLMVAKVEQRIVWWVRGFKVVSGGAKFQNASW